MKSPFDDPWQFNYLWEKMQKRVDQLERDIFWLKKYKREKEAEEYAKEVRENIRS